MTILPPSLLSRFRGAVLGSFLGEAVGISLSRGLATGSSAFRSSSLYPSGEPHRSEATHEASAWVKLQHQLLQQLIASAAMSATPARQPILLQLPADANSHTSLLAELALMTLPVALLYHDQPQQMHFYLEQAITAAALSANVSPVAVIGARVVGQCLSLMLRQRFETTQLIPQLLRDLDWESAHLPQPFPPPQAVLVEQLAQVQDWLTERIHPPLSQLAAALVCRSEVPPALDPAPIALALFSFLSTPEAFAVTVRRATQLGVQSRITASLAGALGGAYSGLAGIPLPWRRIGAGSLEAELMQSADELLAVWAGANQPSQWLQQPLALTVVAAPRAIRHH
ncbi:MAG: ADP-ribosylglycohydrolase family protein [Synechococcales cyanobacterium M58_A2018_015]|nr:ADP-ribosylglycohydrolase family protein [Synechococcales cyanobacterium M58_A2018_015]